MRPDILVFPKIDNSYAIKTGQAIHSSEEPMSIAYAIEWHIFAWKGYRIGTYYEKPDGSGYLYLLYGGVYFHGNRKYDMKTLKSAVAYSWLKTHQMLFKSDLTYNDKKLTEFNGPIYKQYDIRAFAGGPHESTIVSFFNAENKLIARIDETGMNLTGFVMIDNTLKVLTYRKNDYETSEEMMKRMAEIIKPIFSK